MNRSDKILKDKLVTACRFIENSEQIPTLKQVADAVHWSPAYFQKRFSSSLGISPRQYADAIRYNRLRNQLKKGNDISCALYDAGFGSSSRLYEFAKLYLGMTPRSYQNKGKGKDIKYMVAQSPLGFLLLAATSDGICAVSLADNKKALIQELSKEFPEAKLEEKEKKLQRWTQSLIDYLSGVKPWPLLPYDVQATAFQRKVWDYLRTIPAGKTYNYSALAKAIGQPQAARAVARACATNPVALVIPCHRITPKAGGVGGYRWETKRKKKLLILEKNNSSLIL